MEKIFVILIQISIVAFLVSWVNADIFIKLFKNKFGKSGVRTILGLSIIVFFIAFGISTDSTENKTSNNAKRQESTKSTNTPTQQEDKNSAPQVQPVKEEKVVDLLTLEIIEQESNLTTTENNIEIKGRVQPVDAKVSLTGSAKLIKVDSDGRFSFPVILEKGENEFNFIAEKDNLKKEKLILITHKQTAEEIRAEFKAESKKISYKELFRNIYDYKDTKVYFTGKVIQVMGDGNFLSGMRVYVTRGSYDIWDDVVLLYNLDTEAPKILEDDIIKFWGVVEGETTYQTVLGASVTVPEINGEIIELVK